MRTNVRIRNDDGTLGPEASCLSNLIIAGDVTGIVKFIENLDPMATVTILTDALTAPDRIIDGTDLDVLAKACNLANETESQKLAEHHAKPGTFCPTCGETHCVDDNGHRWNEDNYCNHCGADGLA